MFFNGSALEDSLLKVWIKVKKSLKMIFRKTIQDMKKDIKAKDY